MEYIASQGFTTVYSNLLDERDDAVFYAKGRILGKLLLLLRTMRKRFRDLGRIRSDDIVLIHREAFMTWGTWFERAIRRRTRHLIFDFDDAIWRMDVSPGNRALRWLKDPGKTGRIIALADRVIAGNDYLADYARRSNENVLVIPTVIDTERYRPQEVPRSDGRVVIGWTGSHTSMAHLQEAVPMLRKLQQRHRDRIVFRVISDMPFAAEGLDVEFIPWNTATESEDLAPIDIGIMPMPDNEWSRGKCGFKGLQYMGMGKAVVLADIGVNRVIVEHGRNGMLARTEADWSEHIGRLIEDADLRLRLGAEARRTVEERWSVKAWEGRYVQLFNELIHDDHRNDRTEEDRAQPRA